MLFLLLSLILAYPPIYIDCTSFNKLDCLDYFECGWCLGSNACTFNQNCKNISEYCNTTLIIPSDCSSTTANVVTILIDSFWIVGFITAIYINFYKSFWKKIGYPCCFLIPTIILIICQIDLPKEFITINIVGFILFILLLIGIGLKIWLQKVSKYRFVY